MVVGDIYCSVKTILFEHPPTDAMNIVLFHSDQVESSVW